ncbi:MAG: FkbM family methyltransferase [Stellaceae bacterium]
MNTAAWVATSLFKTVLPNRVTATLRRLSLERRRRGRPFPFVVLEPQSGRTLNCCIAYNKYGAYCVPVSGLHRPAALYLLAGEVWEPPTIDLMISHCQHGDMIHAGTFFGDFLPALAAASSAVGGKVWAFEPNPESYRCAVITLQLNQIDNVELMNAGLGERSDNRMLITNEGGVSLGGASYLLPSAGDAQPAPSGPITPVRLVTIDETVPDDRPVSVIQLDVEGYEELALTGAMRTIRKYRPLLILETVPGAAWMSEHLEPLGYQIAESFLENTVVRPSSRG